MIRSLVLLAVAALLGCGQPQTGGTSGTESDNALTVRVFSTVTAASTPDWKIFLWPEGQVPDTNGTAPSFQDSLGPVEKATLRIPDGRWSVLVLHGGIGFRAATAGNDTIADTLRPLVTVVGNVVGDGNEWLLLPGLGRARKCSLNGNFQLDSLPHGVLPLAVLHQGRITQGKVWVSGSSKVGLRIVPDSLDGGWIGAPGP